MFPANNWLKKEEYEEICKSQLPSIHKWQMDLGYNLYLASMGGDKKEIEKAYYALHMNNLYFADGMLN